MNKFIICLVLSLSICIAYSAPEKLDKQEVTNKVTINYNFMNKNMKKL